MSLSVSTYENLAMPLVEIGENTSNRLLVELRKAAEELAENPENERQIRNRVESLIDAEAESFVSDADSWPDNELAVAYVRGYQNANGDIESLVANPKDEGNPITTPQVMAAGIAGAGLSQVQQADGGPVIPPSLLAQLGPRGREFFAQNPHHFTFYETFRTAAKDDIQGMMRPIIRNTNDMYRDIAVQSGTQEFRAANVTTRRQMSQDMVKRFANKGITGVVYADGRVMNIENYSEMVGRTMSGRTASQAHLNRMNERGYDLLRMSIHAGASPLCEPWQGGVYSSSGRSDQYPPWDDAVAGGAFHANCLHHVSTYIQGVSPSRAELTSRHPGESALIREHGEAKGNRIIYQATQRQREIERNIRKFKRRQSVSMTSREAERASNKIKQWQQAQRQHTDTFGFLRRKYSREAI